MPWGENELLSGSVDSNTGKLQLKTVSVQLKTVRVQLVPLQVTHKETWRKLAKSSTN
jgi:hypothetical protein